MYRTIHLLVFSFFIQSFMACQQQPESDQQPRARVVSTSIQTTRAVPEKEPAAADILFQSLDSGKSWQDISAGLPKGVQVMCGFANAGAFFLGAQDGLYRSPITPGSWIWEKGFFLNDNITGIFPGQVGPYAMSDGRAFYQNVQGTSIWFPRYNTLKYSNVICVLETRDKVMFLGCANGIMKSDDGEHWNRVLDEGMVTSLVALDSALIGGTDSGILRSTDGGEHWNPALTVEGAAIDVRLVRGRLIAIVSDNSPSKPAIDASMRNRLFTSTDSGRTWHMMGVRPAEGPIYDIAQVGEYLVCTHKAGIFRSSDEGQTWEQVSAFTNGQKVARLIVSDKMIFAITLTGC